MDEAQIRQVERLLQHVAQDSALLRRWCQRDGPWLLHDLERLIAGEGERDLSPPPGLSVPRSDALHRLRERVALGRALLEGSVHTRWQLGQAWVAYEEWSQGNLRLLKSLFLTADEADFYKRPRTALVDPPAAPDDARALHSGVVEMLDRLEQILEHLPASAM